MRRKVAIQVLTSLSHAAMFGADGKRPQVYLKQARNSSGIDGRSGEKFQPARRGFSEALRELRAFGLGSD